MEEPKIAMHSCVGVVKKVEVVTQKNGVITSRVLEGEELEQWKREHGYAPIESVNQTDTEAKE